ncbi:MAG: hypothetical protein V3U20_07770 [Thermoplasmata archaeon]
MPVLVNYPIPSEITAVNWVPKDLATIAFWTCGPSTLKSLRAYLETVITFLAVVFLNVDTMSFVVVYTLFPNMLPYTAFGTFHNVCPRW